MITKDKTTAKNSAKVLCPKCSGGCFYYRGIHPYESKENEDSPWGYRLECLKCHEIFLNGIINQS